MNKPITQNPERYSLGKQWSVSASPDIEPLTFSMGEPLSDVKPFLSVDGIIVSTGEYTMCSPNTLKIMEEMGNPHYDAVTNGIVDVKDKRVRIGGTIPIITININKLQSVGTTRDSLNRNAGVKSVDYIYEGNTNEGIPENLIRQINFTLDEQSQRPGDTFELFDMQLADATVYDTSLLKITTTQEDGKFDQAKLKTFLTDIDKRLSILRTDFNMIQDTYFKGDVPTSKGVKKFVNQIASTSGDEAPFGGDSYTKKESKTTGVSQTPVNKLADAQAKEIAKAKSEADAKALELKTQQQNANKTFAEFVSEARSNNQSIFTAIKNFQQAKTGGK